MWPVNYWLNVHDKKKPVSVLIFWRLTSPSSLLTSRFVIMCLFLLSLLLLRLVSYSRAQNSVLISCNLIILRLYRRFTHIYLRVIFPRIKLNVDNIAEYWQERTLTREELLCLCKCIQAHISFDISTHSFEQIH